MNAKTKQSGTARDALAIPFLYTYLLLRVIALTFEWAAVSIGQQRTAIELSDIRRRL